MKIINKKNIIKSITQASMVHYRGFGRASSGCYKALGRGNIFELYVFYNFFYTWFSFTWQKQTHRDQIATEQWLLLLGYFLSLQSAAGISLSDQTVFVLILSLYLNISSGALRLLRLNRHITHINNKINIQPYQSISFNIK